MANEDLDIDMEQQEDANIAEQKIINEEYKIWKKNAPFLYDMLMSSALDWPTLTTQWLPDKIDDPTKPGYAIHRLLLGTHTAEGKPNYIQVAHVQIPDKKDPDPAEYDEETGEIGGYGGSRKNPTAEVRFSIVQRIDHPGEVNKARYQPQNPNIFATMCVDGRAMIWDRTKYPSSPQDNVNPNLELLGHSNEGFGLAWNPNETGHLATGSEDTTVRVWDINNGSASNKAVHPLHTFEHHTAIVNDVQYHATHPNVLASVSDDLTMHVFDPRQRLPARIFKEGHMDAINALAFNPDSEYIVVTGSADKTIGVWDLRNEKQKLHSLVGHTDAVTSLEWSPHEKSVLGSASGDRRIITWDLSKVGEEQTVEDAEDGPPELLFMHGGHTNRISDFTWNKNDPWVICSAAEDNLIQVWRPSNAIVGAEDIDPMMNDLEQ